MSTELHAGNAEQDAQGSDDPEVAESLIDDEVLVEEISIDGMCGVY